LNTHHINYTCEIADNETSQNANQATHHCVVHECDREHVSPISEKVKLIVKRLRNGNYASGMYLVPRRLHNFKIKLTYEGAAGGGPKLYFSMTSAALEMLAGQLSVERGSRVVLPWDIRRRPVVRPKAQTMLTTTPATAPYIPIIAFRVRIKKKSSHVFIGGGTKQG
jgi:hypothetical protein